MLDRKYRYNDLFFRFGGCTVNRLSTDRVLSRGNSGVPHLAFVSLDTIHAIRRKYISRRYRLGRRHNLPVASLRQRRLSKLEPLCEPEDPYLAAVLIALAQEQRESCRPSQEGSLGVENKTCLAGQRPITSYKVRLTKFVRLMRHLI